MTRSAWHRKWMSRPLSTTFTMAPFHSMRNISLYNSRLTHFVRIWHRFRDINVSNLWHWKHMSRTWCAAFAVAPSDGKHMISYLITIVMFPLFLYFLTILQDVRKEEKCQNSDLQMKFKVNDDKLELAPFDWKCLILYRWFSSELFISGIYFT